MYLILRSLNQHKIYFPLKFGCQQHLPYKYNEFHISQHLIELASKNKTAEGERNWQKNNQGKFRWKHWNSCSFLQTMSVYIASCFGAEPRETVIQIHSNFQLQTWWLVLFSTSNPITTIVPESTPFPLGMDVFICPKLSTQRLGFTSLYI